MGYVIRAKARYRSDNTGREVVLPALLTEKGVLISHLRYLAKHQARSQRWHDRAVFAMSLLLRYIHANQDIFDNPTKLLESFTHCLFLGTVNPVDLTDPSGLYWQPRAFNDANNLLRHITVYTDHLARQPDHDGKLINPFRRATGYEERMNWCAYYHYKSKVFLNHLEDADAVKARNWLVRDVVGRRAPAWDYEEVKRFPENRIDELLEQGFIRRDLQRRKEDFSPECLKDYKCILITMLMHYGGVRKSEAIGLYTEDVFFDPTTKYALVRVYHPSIGESPSQKYGSRREYLAKRYYLKPRTDYPTSKRVHLGWKGAVIKKTGGFFVVEFFPPEKALEFNDVFQKYLKYQRVRPSNDSDHPYLFTTAEGKPENVKNFQRLYRAAVLRIGLAPNKYHGTTEHGHRHAYGYRLHEEYGFTQIEIQKAMHHKDENSCLVYIQPTSRDLRDKVRVLDD
ncbi:site-specific integrase [Pseudomonas putida]|uniref:gamma-mobile-trio recombinase GmtY n=1 Tax=Pseudomonas putida TaxID=303 RepID=UPI00117A9827|nr:gamma-mobile-trio recombinase GmtY [Pseudomonas putida]TRO37832.1 site-specific integrase [Pseudomonas putida]